MSISNNHYFLKQIDSALLDFENNLSSLQLRRASYGKKITVKKNRIGIMPFLIHPYPAYPFYPQHLLNPQAQQSCSVRY